MKTWVIHSHSPYDDDTTLETFMYFFLRQFCCETARTKSTDSDRRRAACPAIRRRAEKSDGDDRTYPGDLAGAPSKRWLQWLKHLSPSTLYLTRLPLCQQAAKWWQWEGQHGMDWFSSLPSLCPSSFFPLSLYLTHHAASHTSITDSPV